VQGTQVTAEESGKNYLRLLERARAFKQGTLTSLCHFASFFGFIVYLVEKFQDVLSSFRLLF
jgi:hypothetical protein